MVAYVYPIDGELCRSQRLINRFPGNFLFKSVYYTDIDIPFSYSAQRCLLVFSQDRSSEAS